MDGLSPDPIAIFVEQATSSSVPINVVHHFFFLFPRPSSVSVKQIDSLFLAKKILVIFLKKSLRRGRTNVPLFFSSVLSRGFGQEGG